VDVGRQIGIDVDGLQQARGKEADAEASRAAAEAEEAKQRADDVHAQTMESLDAMLQKIITFLKELQQAEVDAMRAFTRASTPTVVARQVVGAGEVVLVDVPAGFRGRHHVVVIDPASGLVTAVQPFDVAAAAGDAGEDASDTAAALPDTGAQVGAGLVPLGVVLLLLGAASLVVARRGRAS
jgi:LPXTG-motif cell wall-anchored protein